MKYVFVIILLIANVAIFIIGTWVCLDAYQSGTPWYFMLPAWLAITAGVTYIIYEIAETINLMSMGIM